jgi:hypothetical protein
MANVTYYPAQTLSVNDGQIQLVQSADVDFSISRQDVFEFGNLYAVDNIQVEPATATLNFSYALATGINNHTKLGLNDLSGIVSDSNGKDYKLSGAGLLSVPSGVITSYSIEGSVGNVPTVSVSVQAVNATYTTGSSYPLNPAGDETIVNVVRPDQINLSLNNTGFECRSFSYTLDIGREYINKLGSLTPIANIVTTPPKVTVEAELVLRNDNPNPKFANDSKTDVNIDCGGVRFAVTGAKFVNFTTNATLDDIQVASITLEVPIRGTGDLHIGG